MSISFDRQIIGNKFKTKLVSDDFDIILGFDLMHGIGDAMVALSIIQDIVSEHQNPKIVFCSCLDNNFEIENLLEIFDIRCDEVIQTEKLQQFVSNGKEVFEEKYLSQNNQFFSFWDIINFNYVEKIKKILLKIESVDLNKYFQVDDYLEIVSVQPYSFNKEGYAKIGEQLDFIRDRWNNIFDSNPDSLFLLLGSENDKNVGQFHQKNVVSLIGQTTLKESCEIILSCNRHMAIESWSQIFCHLIGKQNVQFWDFNVFEIYKYMIGGN